MTDREPWAVLRGVTKISAPHPDDCGCGAQALASLGVPYDLDGES